MDQATSAAALWWAVVASGLYHGLSPGMGWPLAVSAALMDRGRASLARALVALAGGHLVAILLMLLPFSLLTALVRWQEELRIGAALLVIGLGLYLLITRRHPRFLARVPPHRLALWSFLVALAHGAGLMLVPIYLGLCAVAQDSAHAAAESLASGNLARAVQVAFLHTAAMSLAGSAIAVAVYFWLGLRFVSQSWFNLEALWAVSLIAVGVVALAFGHG